MLFGFCVIDIYERMQGRQSRRLQPQPDGLVVNTKLVPPRLQVSRLITAVKNIWTTFSKKCFLICTLATSSAQQRRSPTACRYARVRRLANCSELLERISTGQVGSARHKCQLKSMTSLIFCLNRLHGAASTTRRRCSRAREEIVALHGAIVSMDATCTQTHDGTASTRPSCSDNIIYISQGNGVALSRQTKVLISKI